LHFLRIGGSFKNTEAGSGEDNRFFDCIVAHQSPR
jgi:hypothetical protein